MADNNLATPTEQISGDLAGMRAESPSVESRSFHALFPSKEEKVQMAQGIGALAGQIRDSYDEAHARDLYNKTVAAIDVLSSRYAAENGTGSQEEAKRLTEGINDLIGNYRDNVGKNVTVNAKYNQQLQNYLQTSVVPSNLKAIAQKAYEYDGKTRAANAELEGQNLMSLASNTKFYSGGKFSKEYQYQERITDDALWRVVEYNGYSRNSTAGREAFMKAKSTFLLDTGLRLLELNNYTSSKAMYDAYKDRHNLTNDDDLRWLSALNSYLDKLSSGSSGSDKLTKGQYFAAASTNVAAYAAAHNAEVDRLNAEETATRTEWLKEQKWDGLLSETALTLNNAGDNSQALRELNRVKMPLLTKKSKQEYLSSNGLIKKYKQEYHDKYGIQGSRATSEEQEGAAMAYAIQRANAEYAQYSDEIDAQNKRILAGNEQYAKTVELLRQVPKVTHRTKIDLTNPEEAATLVNAEAARLEYADNAVAKAHDNAYISLYQLLVTRKEKLSDADKVYISRVGSMEAMLHTLGDQASIIEDYKTAGALTDQDIYELADRFRGVNQQDLFDLQRATDIFKATFSPRERQILLSGGFVRGMNFAKAYEYVGGSAKDVELSRKTQVGEGVNELEDQFYKRVNDYISRVANEAGLKNLPDGAKQEFYDKYVRNGFENEWYPTQLKDAKELKTKAQWFDYYTATVLTSEQAQDILEQLYDEYY